MVVPKGAPIKKTHVLDNRKDDVTSLKPEPFREPPGMMTIDLNKSDENGDADVDRAKLRQKSQIKYVTRLLIVLCTALVLSLLLAAGLTLFEQRVHLFTVLPPHQEISQQTKLKDALLLSNVLENMDIQLCRKLQTPESCCEFTKNTQTAKILSELCTVNNMLKILEEFEERARFKRQVGPYPEQWGFNPNDERVNILFEHNDPLPPYFQRNFFPFSQEEMLGNAPFLESPQKKPLVSKFSDVKIIKGDTSAVNENFLTNYEHDRVSGLNIAPPVKITKNPADLELSTTVLPAEMRLAIIPTEVIPEIISTQSEAQRSYLKEDFLPFTQKDMLVNDPFVESPQKKPLVSKFSDVKVIKEDTSAVNENVPNNGDKDRIPGISIAPPVIITKNPADLEPSTTVLPVEMRLTITPTQVNQEISFTRTELQRPNFERDFFPFSQEEMPGNDPFLGSPEKKSLAAKFGNSKIIKKNSTSSKYSYSELKGSEDTAGLKIVPTVNISSKPEDLNLTTSALPLENRIVTVPSKVITEENKPSELFNSQVNDDEYEFKISSDTKQNDISTAPLVQSFFTMKLPEHTKQDILEHITLAPQELVVSEMSASENTLFVGSPQKKPLVSKFGDVVVVRGKNSSSKDNPTKLDAGEDSDIIHINIIPPMKISKKSGNPKPAAGTPIAISSTEKISENDLISTDTLPTTLRNNLITEETSINRKKRQYNLREDFLPKIPFFPSSNHFGNSQDSSLMQHFPEKPISKPTEQDLISAQDRNAFPEQFSFQNPPIPQMKPLVSKFTDTEVTKENNDKFSKLSRNEDVAAMKIVPPTKITTQLDKLPEKYGSGANHEVSGFPQKKPSVSKFGDRVEIQENNPSKDAQSIDFRTSGDESEFKTASNDKIAKKSDDFMPREDFEDLPPVITEHILGDSDKFPLVAHFENSMQDVPKSKSMNSHPEISKIIDLKGDPSRATNDLLEKSKQQRPIEDFAQSNQLIFSNPCFNSPKDPGLLKVVSMSQARAQSQPPLFVLNPSLFYNMPPTGTSGSYFPNLYYPPMPPMPQTIQSITANPPVQVTAPGGQFLLCNPIPTPLNSAAGVPQVEVRRNTGNLQDLFLDMNNGFSYRRGNESRAASLFCSVGEFECLDNSRCIKKYQVCDNEVHCDDSSDEAACTCKERVGKLRHCDGYCDCPRCEDEDGCFGCSEGEFSCDDWSRFRRATCIPLEQRCDGVKQCEITGKDETDCAILADHLGNFPINKVSNSVGFLHRNYKGKWYPTCFGTELWAAEVCEIEAGPSSITPKAHMTLTTNPYRGSFINILPNNEVTLVNTCVQDRAAFVECPPIYCGLRFIINNPYRDSEVDTSMEEMLNDLERAYEIRGEVPQEMILGQSRVVGGKPSQPSAWPWLVSIFKNGYFHCAGVLINDQWVITAAHCIDRHWQNYYEIQAGTLRRFSYAPMDQRRWVTAVVPHEQYEKANLRNDIAVMKLSSPLRYNRHVRPICLPSATTAGKEYLKGPSPGTICTTVGWGAITEHGSDPDNMREVEVPILEHCKYKEDSDEDEICAGLAQGGKDACQGDSGGPLMCQNPNNAGQWYLAGIVSHGQGCARPHEPGVYTKVARYLEWIAKFTREDRLTIPNTQQKCPGYICNGIRRCIGKKRRCDGTIDCLLGDDEMGCEDSYNNIFKHSRTFQNDILNLHDDQEEIIGMSLNQTKKVEELTFRCTNILQVIPMEKHCNKVVDCEDGSDETDCTCAHYVRSFDRAALCDGTVDCEDRGDEAECSDCDEDTETVCRLSRQCILKTQWCDGHRDCPGNEDEMDCGTVALTDGSTVFLDAEDRPQLQTKGLVTINKNGTWTLLCINSTEELSLTAASTCSSLGFHDYSSFSPYSTETSSIKTSTSTNSSITVHMPKKCLSDNCCQGVFLSCSDSTFSISLPSDSLKKVLKINAAPWTVSLFDNGIFTCTGALLNNRWILTQRNCLNLTHGYLTAVLGMGKLNLNVKAPYEQLFRIEGVKQIPETDILLGLLDHEVKFNRYVQPANINSRWHGDRKLKCFVTGRGNDDKVVFLQLFPAEKCPEGSRCFGKLIEDDCRDIHQWGGAIFCDTGFSWFPAAIFYENQGHCAITSSKAYTSIPYYKKAISRWIEGTSVNFSLTSPQCKGLRCNLGNCIPHEKLCDGINDCHDGGDETTDVCAEKEDKCYIEDTCDCPRSHFKCPNNGKCILKSSFCDGVNDCGGFEDEPPRCSCREYLKLSDKTKICDGKINCADRSDEDPKLCGCKPQHFRCKNENVDMCVSMEMVCDGHNDCPNGEDEAECLMIDSPTGIKANAGELLRRNSGIWHSGCFKQSYPSHELNYFCTELGFNGTSAHQLSSTKENLTALKPRLDPFHVVWLNRHPGRRLRMVLRSGNNALVSFVKDDQCFRLNIACT